MNNDTIQQKISNVMQLVQNLQIQSTYGNASSICSILATLQDVSAEINEGFNTKVQE